VNIGSDFGVVFCGGGPAALGPFVAAARLGRFDELLARRVLIVDRGTRIGAGSLRHYRISSNSFGGAFVEGIDSVRDDSPLAPARLTAATRELRAHRDRNVPLRIAGAYLDGLGDLLQTALERDSACAVACCTTVSEIALQAGGGVAITLVRDGVDRTIRAERAVLSMGGRPSDALDQLEIWPSMALARWSAKMQPVTTLLDDRKFLPGPLLDQLQSTGRIVIVGGSHSAWSAALVLLRDLRVWTGGAPTPQITLLHRSPIRLFYLTAAEATADGFPFDPVRDVCPLSGRVNRASGLKGEARDLARRVLPSNTDGELPINLINLADPSEHNAAAGALDRAAVIFIATGFRSVLPTLHDEAGRPVGLASRRGGLLVSGTGALVTKDGQVLTHLHACGLGVHTPVSERIGGEPSYDKTITSTWLYQHDLGQSVLEGLLGAHEQDGRPKLPLLARAGLGW
jgi:hypothetical protein